MVKGIGWTQGHVFFEEPHKASLRVFIIGMVVHDFRHNVAAFQATWMVLRNVLLVPQVSSFPRFLEELYLGWRATQLSVFFATT